ncbi:helix-turn-helix domain-containing protein [Alteromonas pelagimontana]|uniref:Helix-turn-helix domain-containing protein n=1 Tax=Alteromonas pelagimontana TaxID=1858656 RepID=A0A6M4MDR4_9ALTE|nr:helix-turn-helix domain-containing protein [Alteromonas pelagimontana]QJR80760.1 helix-turn-helix domain-containing protein [Alteromonas pelagimontana]
MERYLIPSVFQAIQLCDLLAKEVNGLSAADIEEALSLPQSTVFRLLRTLISERVVQKRGKRYFHGNRIYEISATNAEGRYLQRLLAPAVASLLANCDCSVIVSVPSEFSAFIIDVIDRSPNRISSFRPGTRLSLLDSAPGHVMLAYHPDFTDSNFKSTMRDKLTPPFDSSLALKHRTQTCTRGFAISYFHPNNTTMLAIPVFIHHGELAAILAIELPNVERDTQVLQTWGNKLKMVARLASASTKTEKVV